MRNILKWIIGIIFITNLSSCSSEIEFDKIVDSESSFILTKYNENRLDSQGVFEIDTLKVGSKKHEKLLKFLMNNSKKWNKSHASFIGDISIRQGKMNLTRIKNGLVLNFTDKKNESNQLTKTIDTRELEFLKK
ncbi:MAG: hypothetical protein ACSHWW_10610 [Nonlabens sp.]|uniref:hypothetical protein n=1 Tax=Nonlabens sp. TaxID=1888209 RepID=UPI003EFA33C5